MTSTAPCAPTPIGIIKEPIEKANDGSVQHVESKDDEKLAERLDRFGSAAKTDPREIALVKKLDLYLMVGPKHSEFICAKPLIISQPILWFMYFLNFLCRNAIVNGKLNNLPKELHMSGTEYNTCVSIFFVG